MRLIKMTGLAAVAAIATMAFVGAGSAMATGSSQLCANSSEPCNAPAGAVHFTSVGEPLVLTLTPNLHILCLSGLASGNAEALGNPTGFTVTALLWTGCYTLPKQAAHNCVIETLVLGLLDVLKTAANLGTGTALGTKFLVKCGEIIHCAYGGPETKGLTVEGALHTAAAGHGRVKASSIPLTAVLGALCPKAAHWTATYESLTHLWVSS